MYFSLENKNPFKNQKSLKERAKKNLSRKSFLCQILSVSVDGTLYVPRKAMLQGIRFTPEEDFSGFMNSSNLLHLRYFVSQVLYWNLIGIRNRLHTSINLGASHIHAGMVIWQFAGYVRQWFYPQTRLIASGKVFRLARKLFTLQNSE